MTSWIHSATWMFCRENGGCKQTGFNFWGDPGRAFTEEVQASQSVSLWNDPYCSQILHLKDSLPESFAQARWYNGSNFVADFPDFLPLFF